MRTGPRRLIVILSPSVILSCNLYGQIPLATVDGWAQVYERPCWSQICHFPSRVWNMTMYLRVSVEHLRCSHSCTRRFLCASTWSSGTREKGENHQKIFSVFIMLEVEPKYTYKRSHGSAEIRSLYRVENQESLLSIYKWSHGSAGPRALAGTPWYQSGQNLKIFWKQLDQNPDKNGQNAWQARSQCADKSCKFLIC